MVISLKNFIFDIKNLHKFSFFFCQNSLDLDDTEWKYCKSMPKAKAAMGIVDLNGYLYTIGGCYGKMSFKSVERYSPFYDEWSSIKSMNVRRIGPLVTVLNNKIYAIGGYDKSESIMQEFWKPDPLSSAECYDPNTDTWTMVKLSFFLFGLIRDFF